jgi:uncharacterized protein YbbK (DUF523 family)
VQRDPLLVSACLLGLPTRLDGGANFRAAVAALSRDYLLVPVCPEQLGGLATPRPPAEIQRGAGAEVLAGDARVVTSEGLEVTEAFVRGARAVAEVGRLCGAKAAVLKARSPSCGVGETYDGTFSHHLRCGSGVTASVLEAAGIEVWTEEDVGSGRGPGSG